MIDLVVTYGGVVAHKNQQTGVSNKKRFRHIQFLEDDLLHAIS